jgi:hypothetical protein
VSRAGKADLQFSNSGQVNKLAGEETKTCLFCHSNKKVGLNILAAFICCDCERELVNTSCNDGIYQVYLKNLKKFWHGVQSEVKDPQP